MKKLIGVHGKKGSGKDTVAILMAQYVRKVYHMEAVVKHYADPLKNGLSAMFDIPVQRFYDEVLKEQIIPELGVTPRSMMTRFHDLVVPIYGDQVWVRPVQNAYHEWKKTLKSGVFIVADVRYEIRETQWIRDEGGAILHVFRDRTDKNAGDHSSEKGLVVKEGDLVIFNDKTLLELRSMVHEDMELFMKR